MTNLEFFVLSDYKYEVINFTFYFYFFFFTSIIYIQILSFTQILHKKNIKDAVDLFKKYPKAKGVISYHTNVIEVSDIINKTRPRLTILNHVLSLDGSSDDEILNVIKQNTKHDVLIAKDLMTIDVKDDIYIYKQKNL